MHQNHSKRIKDSDASEFSRLTRGSVVEGSSEDKPLVKVPARPKGHRVGFGGPPIHMSSMAVASIVLGGMGCPLADVSRPHRVEPVRQSSLSRETLELLRTKHGIDLGVEPTPELTDIMAQ